MLILVPLFQGMALHGTAFSEDPTLERGRSYYRRNKIDAITYDSRIKNNNLQVGWRSNQETSVAGRVQKIVILPGPHKTGTTSVQFALRNWIVSQYPSFHGWAWPAPTLEELHAIHAAGGPSRAKDYALLWRLFGLEKFGGRQASTKAILSLFRKKFQQAWDRGDNLLIAAEFLDVIASEKETLSPLNVNSGAELIDRLLMVLPESPAVQREVVVVVHHREPRIDHLISLWHQLGAPKQSLSRFITASNGFVKHAHKLNSMGLADVFVKSGLPVVILDTAGAKRKKVDLSAAIACLVMGVPCDHRGVGKPTVRGIDDQETTGHRNEKDDRAPRDLAKNTLDVIEQLMTEYDCQFQNSLREGKVKFLFADKLFRTCLPTSSSSKVGGQRGRKFSNTVKAIAEVVCTEEASSNQC